MWPREERIAERKRLKRAEAEGRPEIEPSDKVSAEEAARAAAEAAKTKKTKSTAWG